MNCMVETNSRFARKFLSGFIQHNLYKSLLKKQRENYPIRVAKVTIRTCICKCSGRPEALRYDGKKRITSNITVF